MTTYVPLFVLSLVVSAGVLALVNTEARAGAPGASPPQIPLCMIGDSITWAEEGDCWRKYLVEQLPILAFVGTHTAKFGYSHAGEGGNSTHQVLDRMTEIPACPYYSVLIGTNDHGVPPTASDVDPMAAATAQRIVKIVNLLLQKPGAKKVFLASVLPCHYPENPFRTVINGRINVFLKEKLGHRELPKDKVVWVDYESAILATPNWQPLIRVHPTPEGYRLLARVLAGAIRKEFGITGIPEGPRPLPGEGVRVVNLWDARTGQTAGPVIAGWYTVSFDVTEAAAQATVTLRSRLQTKEAAFLQAVPVRITDAGRRREVTFFTGYEGYGYGRCPFEIIADHCRVDKVLFEKMRPGKRASIYRPQHTYIDNVTAPSPGELIERP